MRLMIGLWAAPMALFWSWYFLSLNDMNFGYVMLSRGVHDLLFELYGNLLGIDPAALPPMVARACMMDSVLLAGIIAFRRRRAIRSWWVQRKARYAVEPAPSA